MELAVLGTGLVTAVGAVVQMSVMPDCKMVVLGVVPAVVVVQVEPVEMALLELLEVPVRRVVLAK